MQLTDCEGLDPSRRLQRLDFEAQQYIPVLNERRVFALRAKSAMTWSEGPVPFYMQPSLGGSDGKGVLIVDDLVDTGRTAKIVRDMLPGAHFATVYAKPMGRPLVDTFITEVSQDTWIFFPWDLDLKYAEPIRDGRRGEEATPRGERRGP